MNLTLAAKPNRLPDPGPNRMTTTLSMAVGKGDKPVVIVPLKIGRRE